MPTIITQRIGALSRLVMTPETTPGVAAVNGLLLPLRDKSGFTIKQGTTEAPVYRQSLLPYQRVYGPIAADGNVPLGLEFLTLPAILKLALGAPTKTAMAAYYCHDFTIPSGVPTLFTCGLQNEWGESTAQVLRAEYCRPKSFSTSFAPSGVTPVDVAFVGSGQSSTTTNGGAVTDNGYAAVSMFNGQAKLNSLPLTGMTAFKWTLDTGVTPAQVAFNGGIAASVNPDVINVNGTVELAMATDGSSPENNLYFYTQAVNQGFVPLRVLWANNTPASGLANMFMEIIMPTCRFDRMSPVAGGKTGITISQNYNLVDDVTSGKIAADNFGANAGPYAITLATNDVFTIKIDGGANVTVTLTPGVARTTDQVVADLNGDGGFSAVATADNFLGRVRVTSKQISVSGASSSVQFITGVLHGCETTLGFIGTAMAGYNSPMRIRFWNSQSAAY